MPKAEKGTPKDIAKRIKAKGLQKLKFYCQMCEKQCRDANGFKCHLTSESHLRQMKIFSENAKGIMDRYSREFETYYLQTLRQRHTTKRVNANNVYQEMIQDKQHIHMNSTRWATLTDFVMYLGKTGKCVVDETERGWYVQYIENDASILARKEMQERRAEAEKAAEMAQAERMERQRVEAAKALDRVGGTVRLEATKLERSEDDKSATVSVALKMSSTGQKKNSAGSSTKKINFFGESDDDDDEENDIKVAPSNIDLPSPLPLPTSNTATKRQADGRHDGPAKRLRPNDHGGENNNTIAQDSSSSKKTTLENDIINNNNENLKNSREAPWLKRDIIVRIITKKLADGKYFRRKAIVDHVLKEDKFCAEVEVLDSDGKTDGGDILRLDQSDLETVVPKEGKKVRILRGEHRGEKAKVMSLDKKKYRATLKLVDDGTLLEKVDFEDFSQLA